MYFNKIKDGVHKVEHVLVGTRILLWSLVMVDISLQDPQHKFDLLKYFKFNHLGF